MQHRKERPMRFLRMDIQRETVPAQILNETLTSFHISLWFPEHISTHDGTLVPGKRVHRNISKDDHRIIDVDDKYDPPWEGNVVDLFIAEEELVLRQLG